MYFFKWIQCHLLIHPKARLCNQSYGTSRDLSVTQMDPKWNLGNDGEMGYSPLRTVIKVALTELSLLLECPITVI